MQSIFYELTFHKTWQSYLSNLGQTEYESKRRLCFIAYFEHYMCTSKERKKSLAIFCTVSFTIETWLFSNYLNTLIKIMIFLLKICFTFSDTYRLTITHNFCYFVFVNFDDRSAIIIYFMRNQGEGLNFATKLL